MDYYESTSMEIDASGFSGSGSNYSFNGQIAVAQMPTREIPIGGFTRTNGAGLSEQTINVCVNGAAGTMIVLGAAPAENP